MSVPQPKPDFAPPPEPLRARDANAARPDPLTTTAWATDRAGRLPAVVPARPLRLVGRRQARAEAVEPALLSLPAFRLFWFAKLASTTATGAMVFAFLLMVADQTGRATDNALFVACSIVPAILFGLPAGVVGDRLPRRPMMVGLSLARLVFAAALVVVVPSMAGIFAATLALWTIHQFHAPVESAALVDVIPPGRLVAAQSMSNLAGTLAQVAGVAILAPLALKTVGTPALFAVCAALYTVAAGLFALLPRLDRHLETRAAVSFRRALLDGWHGIRATDVTLRALICDVLIGIGMSALVVIVPLYLKRVLDAPTENSVFIFAPAAIGLFAGLRFAAPLGRWLGPPRVAAFGLLGFAVCVGALGLVEEIRHGLVAAGLPFDQFADLLRIPSLVLLVMLVAVPAGFFSATVSVTTRAILLGQTAPSRRVQTIATTALVGNLWALLPTLLAGIAADRFGVERVAIATALALAVGGVAAWTVVRPVPLRPVAASSLPVS